MGPGPEEEVFQGDVLLHGAVAKACNECEALQLEEVAEKFNGREPGFEPRC